MDYKPPEDFEKDIHINEFALAQECLTQPSLYWSYAEAAVKARKQVQKLQDKLTLKKATLDAEIREDATYGTKKVTEAGIASMIIVNEEYQLIQKDLRAWESVRDTYETAVRAIAQRKDMLDNFTKLQIAGLYSAPSNNLRKKMNGGEQ